MNHDRRLLVVLNNDRGDLDLIRYAVQLARLNASASQHAREVKPVPSTVSRSLPLSVALDGDPDLVPTPGEEGGGIVLSAASRDHQLVPVRIVAHTQIPSNFARSSLRAER